MDGIEFVVEADDLCLIWGWCLNVRVKAGVLTCRTNFKDCGFFRQV